MSSPQRTELPHASEQDGTYPRPQLMRTDWQDLTGVWDFAFDDDNRGIRERWYAVPRFDRTIVVPFPPESPASSVNDRRFHLTMWYSRTFSAADVMAAGHNDGRRLMLRFGAVDYRAIVWVNGQRVGSHEGGHTPFAVDITDAIDDSSDDHLIVVRVEDSPLDVAQPRGKQDWREDPHVIWYHRTSGIWQPVWLESVPRPGIDWIHWRADVPNHHVHARVGLTASPMDEATVDVKLSYEGTVIGRATVMASGTEVEIVVPLARQSNGQAYEELLWSPLRPRLIDAEVEVRGQDGTFDTVASYMGLRTVAVDRGVILLNDRPCYLRSVLTQGYWPESHLAAPSAEALCREVQLIKELGFNATRVHQKFEDPRFLYWADRLGVMVWGEAPASFSFNSTSVGRMMREWLEVLHRDMSHPSIVTWVPLNESWGVQHISHDDRMPHYARSLVHITKALDPTRPVVSNDGWEQVDTDILAIHDYEHDGPTMQARYGDRTAIQALLDGVGPAGRRLVISGDVSTAPVVLTEFGGISYDVHLTPDAWGYSDADSADDFRRRLPELMTAIHSSRALAGFCYTQLADTLQETNGLVDADRNPKLPIEEIRRIMIGPHAKKMLWE